MNPSGSAIVSTGNPTQIMASFAGGVGPLRCGPNPHATRCEGMATLHVHTQDETVIDPAPALPSAKLTLSVSWRSDCGGGQAFVDATSGHMFTVAGSDVISVDGFFEPLLQGGPLVIPATQKVSVSAHWNTSKSGFPAQYSPPGVTAVPAGSAFVRIPPGSALMHAVAVDPAAVITVQFTQTNTVGAPTIYSAIVGPQRATAVPVVQGARFARFVNPGAVVVYPVFLLWI